MTAGLMSIADCERVAVLRLLDLRALARRNVASVEHEGNLVCLLHLRALVLPFQNLFNFLLVWRLHFLISY